MQKGHKGWLSEKLQDPEFQRYLAREDVIEEFLSFIEREMERQSVSRAELARRLGCRPSNVTQMFRRTRNLTVATMVDVAFHLNVKIRLFFEQLNKPTALPSLWQTAAREGGRASGESAVLPPVRVRHHLELVPATGSPAFSAPPDDYEFLAN